MKVNHNDFQNALQEVIPAFGVSEEELANCLRGGIIHYNSYIHDVLREGKLYVNQVRLAETSPLFSVLVTGPAGCGKTALAAKIALDSEFPFIKLVSAEDMVGFNEPSKIAHITKIFMDAYKSPLSVVVVDSIERIVEWVPIGPRFSNVILQTLVTLLRKQPPKDRRLLILATTTERTVLQNLDMYNHFNADLSVPNLQSYEDLAKVMQESKAFSNEDIGRALHEIKDITGSEDIGVGIKKILLAIETAKQDSDMAIRFASIIQRAINERRVVYDTAGVPGR